jgi:hypothetical protein
MTPYFLDRKRRSKQRGAAVFIVVMAIMLLTSLGLFAIYSAGRTARVAGFNRVSAQALYTAELGILSGTGYLSIPGFGDANYKAALRDRDDPTRNADQCESVPAGEFCKRILMGDIDTSIELLVAASTGTPDTILELTTAEGSMSPYPALNPSAIEGDFWLEMADPRPIDVPGTEVGSGTYQRVTLTSFGMVRPVPASGNLCVNAAGENSAAARLSARAHVIIGPIQ